MVALYVKVIGEGRMTLEEVPSLWKEKVRLELEKQTILQ
ncbi:MAG: CD1375 family protein [Clostridium sp.]